MGIEHGQLVSKAGREGDDTLMYLMSFWMSQWSVSVAAWSARRLSSSPSLSTKSSSDELSSSHISMLDFLEPGFFSLLYTHARTPRTRMPVGLYTPQPIITGTMHSKKMPF